MRSRGTAVVLGILMLTTTVTLLPGAGADVEAPTISAQPALDGRVEETEWASAETFTFSSPRAGTSTIRLGYLESTGQLAWGVVLSDESDNVDDRFDLYIAPREVSSGDATQTSDRKLTVFADGNWELRRGNGNTTTGFPSSAFASGTNPSQTSNEWSFAVSTESVTSWEIEGVVNVGTYEAGDKIKIGIEQTDVNDDGSKTASKTNFNEARPDSWETLEMTGRQAAMQLSVRPANMEAGVGGDILVRLPSDASGGGMTVATKAPGEGGFTPLPDGTVNPASPGQNTFFFSPEKVGTYQIRATWQGDGTYGEREETMNVKVAKPTRDGVTVMETGSLRATFPMEAPGAEGEWRYLNTRVWATDGQGNVLPLAKLDQQNSCYKDGWVGFANLAEGADDGPLVLHFDPPVRRAALALASPSGEFTANLHALQSNEQTQPTEPASGSCSAPAFVSVGDIDDDVATIEIDYTGSDTREVLDVVFPHPLPSSPPHVSVRADPSPLHPGGSATVHVEAGSAHRVQDVQVEVLSGSQTLGEERCTAAASSAWIACPTEIEIPPGTGSVRVNVATTDRFGQSFQSTQTITTEADHMPPKASLLPKPLLATPGGAIAVTATGVDGSGVSNITVTAVDGQGEALGERTCEPSQAERELECRLAITQPDSGTAFVSANYTDTAGNTATVGPKPIPVRGPDQDGDGLPDELELAIGTSPSSADTDGDGLTDGWEVLGVDRDGNGEAELDLAALGANPQVRDIFMEIDYAAHDRHVHAVDYGAIQIVRNVLASRGINLHTDIQEDGGPFDPHRFDHGHAAHRHLIDEARAGVFVHVIAGHMGGPAAGGGGTIYLDTPPAADQSAGIVGAQLLHELGHHLGLGHGGGGTAGGSGDDTAEQAAYREDYKPNYLSIMNNAYAWGIIVETVDGIVRVPSFAGAAVDDLDESSLDEPTGMDFDLPAIRDSIRSGPTHVLEEGTLMGLHIQHSCPGQVRWRMVPGAVDWNCDGGSADTGVEVDLNRGGANSGIGTLVSRTDWDALDLKGPSCPHYALMLTDSQDMPAGDADHGAAYEPLGLAPCPLRPAPQTPLEAQPQSSVTQVGGPTADIELADGIDNDGDGDVDEGFADDDADGVVNILDDCPRRADGAQTDRDRDGRGDWCQAEPDRVSELTATADAATGSVTLRWGEMFDIWGYNIYRIQGGQVTALGSGFPTTQETVYVDSAGSSSARYIVAAVNDLADQGTPTIVSPTVETNGDDDGNGTDDGGSGEEQEGVPSPGALLVLVLTSAAALAVNRRRRP